MPTDTEIEQSVTLEGSTEHRVKLRADADEIKKRIEAAFRRIVEVDSHCVKVEARGCIVTLSGEVRSEAEKQEAQRTAAETPGVTEVRNHISVKA
jgi:osmotically-inducible protein OsmY